MDFVEILTGECIHQEIKILKILSLYHVWFSNYDHLKYQGAHWQLGKKYGKYGNFLGEICEVYGIFQQKYEGNMGKIRVHQTKANIEDKSESKFIHLNITMF